MYSLPDNDSFNRNEEYCEYKALPVTLENDITLACSVSTKWIDFTESI